MILLSLSLQVPTNMSVSQTDTVWSSPAFAMGAVFGASDKRKLTMTDKTALFLLALLSMIAYAGEENTSVASVDNAMYFQTFIISL